MDESNKHGLQFISAEQTSQLMSNSSTTEHGNITESILQEPASVELLPAVPAILVADEHQSNRLEARQASPESSEKPMFQVALPIDALSFPNPPRRPNAAVPSTPANLAYLLESYGVSARYNVIKKKVVVTIPGLAGSPDNFDNVALTTIISLANLNGMSSGNLPNLMMAVADLNQYNPVASWISGKPWDGVNRLPAFYDTLVSRTDFPTDFKEILMYRWLLSATAAALMPIGFHSRGVLTLQGPQEIGKSTWVNSLIGDRVLMAEVILLNHTLDPSNKDTLITAVCHWIVEFGELDGMLKKDVARLKGFITADRDKVRRPFGRLDSEYSRKTVFFATVNDSNFLTDHTGNTRWWTIPVVEVNYQHGIDMQQLFSQLALDFKAGAQWWLTKAESERLELHNKEHRTVSSLHERILDIVDMNQALNSNLPALTPTEVLRDLGIDRPSNAQCKECGAILRELFGDSKRINGRDKWRVPVRSRIGVSFRVPVTPDLDDDHLY
jgi:putative DNA primase/helicase